MDVHLISDSFFQYISSTYSIASLFPGIDRCLLVQVSQNPRLIII
jgi:hypothetical protein